MHSSPHMLSAGAGVDVASHRREPSIDPLSPTHENALAFAQSLITTRSNVSPRRLVGPGPSAQQVEALLGLAAVAPDHGLLTPWRFVLVPVDQRHRLAEAFALALLDRDPRVGDLCQELGVTRQTLYRHISPKGELRSDGEKLIVRTWQQRDVLR